MSDEKKVITQQNKFFGKENSLDGSNRVCVRGTIEEEFKFSYKVLYEKFYRTKVRVRRDSGIEDTIPVVVSELLISDILRKSLKGKNVEINGQFRSYNKNGKDGRRHLDLYVFAKDINIEEELVETADKNLIFLDGYICKKPIYRGTPLGRQITDLIVAVNRSYNNSDYIPCVTWGRGALYASKLEIGDRIQLYGRIQSRQYFKRYSPESDLGEYKEINEISIRGIKKVENF